MSGPAVYLDYPPIQPIKSDREPAFGGTVKPANITIRLSTIRTAHHVPFYTDRRRQQR